MSDEQAFLDAIKANPSDRALRLIYADWLEERGDPRAVSLRLEPFARDRCPVCATVITRASLGWRHASMVDGGDWEFWLTTKCPFCRAPILSGHESPENPDSRDWDGAEELVPPGTRWRLRMNVSVANQGQP